MNFKTNKRGKFLIFALISTLLVACSNSETTDTDTEAVTIEPTFEYGFCVDSLTRVDGVIEAGESVSTLFSNLGISPSIAHKIQFLPDSIFNAKRVKAGNKYFVYFANEADSLHDALENPKYFVYQNTLISYTVIELSDSIRAYNFKKEVVVKERVSEAEIKSSLWNAITENNLDINLAGNLSDIYAWTIDFFGIQKGDGFKVYYTENFVDGESIGIGEIKSAIFKHCGTDYYAIKYDTLDYSGYWDCNGKSLRKEFLKSPLNFKRISSHFTYTRRHPIYNVVRPHTGVDYAAPKGTPVWSIGDGKVVFKGYKGGGGHTIKIKHNSVYSTAYLHLSGYAKGLKVGDRVKQGQVIGYVGSTGSSTGPHLDFRVWKNDSPINPLKLESPSAEPLPEKCMEGFKIIRDKYLQKLK